MNETILAIDPGMTQSAYVEYGGGKLGIFGKIPNMELLRNIRIWCDVPEPFFDVMAIEMLACYGMEVGQSIMETCEWVGIFRHAFGLHKAYKVYRKSQNKKLGIESVCMHLCKNPRAKDKNVRQAIIDRYGGDEIAIGGVKCRKCKGKGWFGPGRPICPVCNGDKWKFKPGPLLGVSTDVWSALAVAITFDETFIRCRNK